MSSSLLDTTYKFNQFNHAMSTVAHQYTLDNIGRMVWENGFRYFTGNWLKYNNAMLNDLVDSPVKRLNATSTLDYPLFREMYDALYTIQESSFPDDIYCMWSTTRSDYPETSAKTFFAEMLTRMCKYTELYKINEVFSSTSLCVKVNDVDMNGYRPTGRIVPSMRFPKLDEVVGAFLRNVTQEAMVFPRTRKINNFEAQLFEAETDPWDPAYYGALSKVLHYAVEVERNLNLRWDFSLMDKEYNANYRLSNTFAMLTTSPAIRLGILHTADSSKSSSPYRWIDKKTQSLRWSYMWDPIEAFNLGIRYVTNAFARILPFDKHRACELMGLLAAHNFGLICPGSKQIAEWTEDLVVNKAMLSDRSELSPFCTALSTQLFFPTKLLDGYKKRNECEPVHEILRGFSKELLDSMEKFMKRDFVLVNKPHNSDDDFWSSAHLIFDGVKIELTYSETEFRVFIPESAKLFARRCFAKLRFRNALRTIVRRRCEGRLLSYLGHVRYADEDGSRYLGVTYHYLRLVAGDDEAARQIKESDILDDNEASDLLADYILKQAVSEAQAIDNEEESRSVLNSKGKRPIPPSDDDDDPVVGVDRGRNAERRTSKRIRRRTSRLC